MHCPQEGDPVELHIITYGVHRVHYEHEQVFGLPAVCICDITGPGLPRLRITPEGVEPADASDLPEAEGRIAFVNGTADDLRMAFPIFNPADARKPDWKTKRRPFGYPWIAPVIGEEKPSDRPHSIHDRLAAIRTCFRYFGRHHVVYHPSLFPNEPTVNVMSVDGPGIPNLRITTEGVELADGTGLDQGQGCLLLYIKITRDYIPSSD
jgi:hypothetical protein